MAGCFIRSFGSSVIVFIYRSSNSGLKRLVVGRLDFGLINPVNEGLTLIWVVALFSGLAGNDIWRKQSPFFGLPYNTALLWTAFIVLFINTFLTLADQHA